jgi:hypothetical protein
MVAYDQMDICISLLDFDRSIMDFPNHEIDFHRHMSCSFMFNELRGNEIGCFDDVGKIFYQLSFNCLLGIAYYYILLHQFDRTLLEGVVAFVSFKIVKASTRATSLLHAKSHQICLLNYHHNI